MKSIANYISAGFACLYAVSHEEERITLEIRKMAKDMGYTLWSWTVTDGLKSVDGEVIKETGDPLKALVAFIDHDKGKGGAPSGKQIKNKSIVVLKDFHMFLKPANAFIVRRLKEAIMIGRASNRHLIILGCQLNLPPELEKELTVIEFELPTRDELEVVASQIAKSAKQELNGNTDKILDAGSGLTTGEFADALAYSIVETKKMDPKVISRIKADTIKKNGVLELVNTDIDLNRIGGLDAIKTWLAKRKAAFGQAAKDYGLPTPKGFLAIGIAGCGKSLIGKATANVLGVPLLKLDGGKIFGSLVGASEQNMRTAIQTAEAVSPCVMMIDELEKAMSGSKSSSSTDGGTASRVLGTFLQWMQDKTSPVFVVATANNISDLPPELLRRGRFDQIFFVDLPDTDERVDIWKIHISRFNRSPKKFDLDKLASKTDGFTGAEIESIVVDGLFASFDNGKEPTTDDFLSALKLTVPLSKTMAEDISAMRTWASGRAVLASAKEPASQDVDMSRKIG